MKHKTKSIVSLTVSNNASPPTATVGTRSPQQIHNLIGTGCSIAFNEATINRKKERNTIEEVRKAVISLKISTTMTATKRNRDHTDSEHGDGDVLSPESDEGCA